MDAERREKLNLAKTHYRVVDKRSTNAKWAAERLFHDGWSVWTEGFDTREGADAYSMLQVFYEYCQMCDLDHHIAPLACLRGGTPDEIVERMHQLAAIVYGVEGADR